MIKQSVFEQELITGMQKALNGQEQEIAINNLSKGAEALHGAMQIFEDMGMKSQADAIFNIFVKIANKSKDVQTLISLQSLFDAGFTKEDLVKAQQGNTLTLAKINLALRDAGYSDEQIFNFLGEKSYLPQATAERWVRDNPIGNFSSWINDLVTSPQVGDTISLSPVKAKKKDKKDKQKGLTSEKMVKNLLNHGTEFNLAKDNFEEQYKKFLESTEKSPKPNKINLDDLDNKYSHLFTDQDLSDDSLLNVDINDADLPEYEEELSDMSFEDEVD